MEYAAPPIPRAFIWRRAHSFTGFWLVLFLIEHLLVNSQAALFIGDDGSGFVTAVNSIKDLPYLPAIELTFIGIPFLIHGLWGVRYLFTSKSNSFETNGTKPALPQYPENHAYTWQRITSWLLLFGILAHVIHMRFLEYPDSAQMGNRHFYMVPLNMDEGLYTLSRRLGFEFYNASQVQSIEDQIISQPPIEDQKTPEGLIAAQTRREQQRMLKILQDRPLADNQVVAVAESFGIAELLMVRDVFKSPTMILLYTGLVLASTFHAFNGLWTFMITWGVTLSSASQRLMRKIATGLMVLVTFLGLAAIWGTYWFNLMQ